MATTTNYSWTTPDDTALVKDGAAAIRSLGTAIDTTVFNNASAAIAKTIVDAKGDIIAATAADTVSRLAVGANDTVLTADSSTATGLKWAAPSSGGMTLLSTTSLSGTSTTISGISGSYNWLWIVMSNIYVSASYRIIIEPNSLSSTSPAVYMQNSSVSYESSIEPSEPLPTTSNTNNFTMMIFDYANTATTKNYILWGSSTPGTATHQNFRGGTINTTTAISSLKISANASPTFNGGTVRIYGVK